jgi:hypothetical protein
MIDDPNNLGVHELRRLVKKVMTRFLRRLQRGQFKPLSELYTKIKVFASMNFSVKSFSDRKIRLETV